MELSELAIRTAMARLNRVLQIVDGILDAARSILELSEARADSFHGVH